MEWGAVMQERGDAYRALQARGRASPLDRRPDIYPDVAYVWTGFHALSGSRSMGMGGVGPIPFDAIDRYADRYRLSDFEEFHALVTAMDAAYLDHAHRDEDEGSD